MQTERGTSGPRRTSKKYFPPLSAGVTISHCVCDMQICDKSQRERERVQKEGEERPDDEVISCFFCMILSVAGSSRIFFFIKSLERLRRGQSYLDDTDA